MTQTTFIVNLTWPGYLLVFYSFFHRLVSLVRILQVTNKTCSGIFYLAKLSEAKATMLVKSTSSPLHMDQKNPKTFISNKLLNLFIVLLDLHIQFSKSNKLSYSIISSLLHFKLFSIMFLPPCAKYCFIINYAVRIYSCWQLLGKSMWRCLLKS